MEIEIDYNPSPSKFFFISVSLNNKEAISFDYTSKGQRVIKQILVKKKSFPNKKPTSEWDTIVLKDGKFIKKYNVKWIDLDKKDWVNDEIWGTVWEKPISIELKNKLLEYSQFVSDNHEELIKFKDKMKEFEKIISRELEKFINSKK
jgi:hypothetical protein